MVMMLQHILRLSLRLQEHIRSCTVYFDTKKILEALIKDVRNGGNANIWDAAAQYVNRSVTPITLNHRWRRGRTIR